MRLTSPPMIFHELVTVSASRLSAHGFISPTLITRKPVGVNGAMQIVSPMVHVVESVEWRGKTWGLLARGGIMAVPQ